MSSRLIRSATVATLALMLVAGGCSIRQRPPESSQFKLNTSQFACMDNIGNQLKSYFAGSASSQDVDAAWNCAEQALDEFKNKTVGAVPGSYSSQEITNFLSRFFVKNVSLTPDLIAQVGTLKQVIVGGAPDRLTDAEIQKFKQFMEIFRAEMQALRPFMPIVPQGGGTWSGMGGMSWATMDSEYLDQFSTALNTAASAIGSALNSAGTAYTFAQLDALVQAILTALPANGEYAGTIAALNSVHQHMPLFEAAKNTLLIPGAQSVSQGNDWESLLQKMASWGETAVRGAWLMDSQRLTASQQELDQGEGLLTLGQLFDQTQGLLMSAVTAHPGQVITFDELDQLVDALSDAGFLSSSFPADDVEGSLRPIVRRVIGGSDLGLNGRGAAGMTPGTLSKLSEIFHNWYEGQRFLQTLFATVEQQEGDSPGPAADYLFSTLYNASPASALWTAVQNQTDPQWNAETKLATERILKLFTTLRPLFHGTDNEITFSKYGEGLRYSFHDLSTLNWMQVLSRQLVEGYAEKDPGESSQGIPIRADADHWQPGSSSKVGAGVSLTEFEQFYSDFRPLGLDLKYFSPTSPNSAYARFREGDVFTYVSDGNGYLDMNEAATLLAFAYSAKIRAGRVHASIASRCHTQALDTFYEQPLIDYSCYESSFYGQVQEYWDKLNEMVAYYDGLTSANKQEFAKLLETSARDKGYQPGVAMNMDDTESLIGSLQYIEAIFSRYDADDSGYLTPDEAKKAFPVFKGTLEQMGKSMNPPIDLDDDTADLVFTYMLAKGSIPSGTWDVVLWDIQKNLPFLGNFQADRLRILQIFAALSSSTRQQN